MRNKLILMLGLLPCFATAYVGAAPLELKCPASIEVEQQLKTPLETDWTGFVSEPEANKPVAAATPVKSTHLLAGITLFDGNPSEMASLAPDEEPDAAATDTSKGAATPPEDAPQVWSFPDDVKQPVWLACNYQGSVLVVAKALPAGQKTCKAYSKDDAFDRLVCE